MANMAKWGPMAFVCSATKLVPLMDLKVTMAAKVESQDDSSGTSKSVVKGKEPEIIGLATRYVRGAGVDPLAKVNEWRAQVGKAYPLYINGKRFGPANMLLKNAEASEILTDNSGRFISLKMTITLEEKAASTTKKKTTKSSTQNSNTSSTTKTSATTATTATSQRVTNAKYQKEDDAFNKKAAEAMSSTALRGTGTATDPYVYKKRDVSTTTKADKTTGSKAVTGDIVHYQGTAYMVVRYQKIPLQFGRKYPVIYFNGKEKILYGEQFEMG